MKKQLLTLLKIIAFLAVGLTILYFLYQSQNASYQKQCAVNGIPSDQCNLLKKLADDFRKTNPFWIILIVAITLLSHLIRALRWNMLIKPLGATPRVINSFLSVIIGFFANLGIPRIGELVRASTLSRYEDIPTEKLVGTVVVDRIVDMVTFIGIVGFAFMLEFHTIYNKLANLYAESMGTGPGSDHSKLIFIFVLLAVVFIAFLAYMYKKPENLVVKKIKGIISGVLEGVNAIRKLKNPWLFMFYTLVIWFCYYIVLYICLPAFGPTHGLGLRAAVIIFVFGALGFIFPSPGGMGTYHWMIIQALLLYNVSEADGFSFANIAYFSGQIFTNVLFGLVALIALPIINSNYTPPHSLVNEADSSL
ncbi:MAG TPA: lysylphosphatidylglycerol synthase transmembrane domain-containing protein [Saprospiraceae bacterium]|nr:lysylphosphatidylglycerol synthase transmembrane domain-containing protein [Saprospiraceae bacterium]